MQSLAQYHIAEQTWLKETGPGNGTAPARLQTLNGTVKPDPDAGLWEPAVVKMVEFQHLGDDWDGQGARAPSHELLASAIGLAYTLKDQGVDPPHCVVAGVEGTVTLEWHDPDGTYTEVEIVRPLFAEVMMIEPGQPARHWTLPNQ